MREVVLSGLVTGWAIAVPVGAVAALLVTLTARTSWRVGASAALGVATVDGVYAAVAVVSGAALAQLLAPVATGLRIASGLVLLALAALTAIHAWSRRSAPTQEGQAVGPLPAYAMFVGVTAVNPATVVYFAAVVLGNRDLVDGALEGSVFVLAAFAASASWQLFLVAAGSGLGRAVTGPRGRLVTGLLAAGVIAGLALHTMLG
ncbi:LysE family transporter [Nocardioides sp.]|uniref:LysE family transporter n=1 Tax=Nocardioides sp. TaxID=35761 RepID=UPI00261308DE|nr:LysE family transporter [Nocardioides sp.]